MSGDSYDCNNKVDFTKCRQTAHASSSRSNNYFHMIRSVSPPSVITSAQISALQILHHKWVAQLIGYRPSAFTLSLFCLYLHAHTETSGTKCLFHLLPKSVVLCFAARLPDRLLCSTGWMSRGRWWGYGQGISVLLNWEYSTPHLPAHTATDRRLIMHQMAVNGPQTACLIRASSSPQALCNPFVCVTETERERECVHYCVHPLFSLQLFYLFFICSSCTCWTCTPMLGHCCSCTHFTCFVIFV